MFQILSNKKYRDMIYNFSSCYVRERERVSTNMHLFIALLKTIALEFNIIETFLF